MHHVISPGQGDIANENRGGNTEAVGGSIPAIGLVLGLEYLVDSRCATARISVIDDVVMNECAGLNEFQGTHRVHHSQGILGWGETAFEAACPQPPLPGEGWTHALAPIEDEGVERIYGLGVHRIDRRDIVATAFEVILQRFGNSSWYFAGL